MLDKLDGRNGSGNFARRSIKNLDFILNAAKDGDDVHPVTQMATSLLATLVFPWERSAYNALKKKHLSILAKEGWPNWEMSGKRVDTNKVKTIHDLLGLLRHSVAHGHVAFDSDSKNPEQVMVYFENFPQGEQKPDWQARIRADSLIEFCRRFAEHIEDYVS